MNRPKSRVTTQSRDQGLRERRRQFEVEETTGLGHVEGAEDAGLTWNT
jgi:hypothetical protein